MQWQTTPYVLLLFVAAVTTFLWALYGIRTVRDGRPRPHILSFVALCLSVGVWAAVYAVQLAAPTLEAKLVAYKVLHVGGMTVPPAWLAFAVAYSGRAQWLTRATVAGIFAIPIASLLALLTNPHSLALTEVSLETRGALTVLVTGNGPLYLLYLAYAYVTIFVGACLITLYAIRSAASIRRQSALLATGALVPLALNVFNVLSVPPFGDVGVNLTPVSLSLSTALFGVAILRYRMFDLTPVAWDVVLAQLSDGVIVLDDRERVVDLNAAAEALLGDGDAAVGARATSFLPQYDRLKRDSPFLVALRADGEDRLVQLTRSPLAKYGTTYGWVVLARDVTDAERRRRGLERQNERLGEFANVVSHDLRNPLNVIEGYAELAERTGEKRYFETIRDAVFRMDTFLEELLILSRRGDTIDEFRPVSLALAADAAREGIADGSLLVDVATDATVMADENRLRQVLDNLFRNARDHNDGGVSVRIGELADGFYVEDDGLGVSPDVRESVFEAGFSTRANGTGLGLAIIRDVVEAHGWRVSVTEGAAGGARFEITGVDLVGRE